MKLDNELQCAKELAQTAGQVILKHYGHVRRLTKHHDESVSEADRESQRTIVAGLKQSFPHYGIIGEEDEAGVAITFDVPNPLGRNWVIDPIDGTNNFLAGLGTFAVCIGLLDAGQPVLGIVLDVVRNQMYWASAGNGAFLDGRKLHVVNTPLSASSLVLLASTLADENKKVPAFATRSLGIHPWKSRCLGSAAIEAALVGAGVAHAALTLNGKLWDIAAAASIVFEAGGMVTAPDGKAIFPFNLQGYSGAKVPFLAAAPIAQPVLLKDIATP